MPKERSRTIFICESCGNESPRWEGKCPACGLWNTLKEQLVQPGKGYSTPKWVVSSEELQQLSEVPQDGQERVLLASQEMNRVLGGGVVAGSLVLMAGEPGVGKSTLLLQVAESIASQGKKVLYVSGEESPQQIKLRSQRLRVSGEGIYLLSETDVDVVVERLDQLYPSLAVVDSIQTLYTQEIPSGPGSIAQVRECTRRLMQWAKVKSVPLFIAGHVTKEGDLAGPRVLEHMVDVVLYLEGENLSTYRILRSVKNRFGSTNEVGVFRMGSSGLEEVSDPSQALLSGRQEETVGSAVVPIIEGSRPLLVEIQALTCPSNLAVPRRVANGVDYNRLLMLAAVLTRRVGLKLSNEDIIVNVTGGLRVTEPAADLAVAVAIASSLRNTPVSPGVIVLGEVGLSGELRSVPQVERRIAEATRLGFRRCFLPASSHGRLREGGSIDPVFVPTVARALRLAFPWQRSGKANSEAETPLGEDFNDEPNS